MMVNIFPVNGTDISGVMKVIQGEEMDVRKGSCPCINFRKKRSTHPTSCKRKGSIAAGADATDVRMEGGSFADLAADLSKIVIL